MNWYAYAGDNPVTGIDPAGLDALGPAYGRSHFMFDGSWYGLVGPLANGWGGGGASGWWQQWGIHGAGVGFTETTDVGLWWASGAKPVRRVLAGSGADRAGPNGGAWASWGGFGRWFSHIGSFPGSDGSNIGALGGFAGGGGMFWLTNATSAGRLRGPFMQYNLNAGRGWKVGGASFAYSNGTWVFAYAGPFPGPLRKLKTGPGYGAAFSRISDQCLGNSVEAGRALHFHDGYGFSDIQGPRYPR